LPQLDNMLRALADRGASELRFPDGDRPMFRFPDGDRPVSKAALQRAQVVTLLSELTDAENVRRLQAGEPVRFAYHLADGAVFECEAHGGDPGLAARVVPQRAAVATVPAPAPAPATPAPAAAAVERPAVATPATGGPDLDAYLRQMVDAGGSDLHLSAGETPRIRVDGDMRPLEGGRVLSADETARLLEEVMPEKNRGEFRESSDTDFAHSIEGVARFRGNVFADNKGTGGVFRVIPSKIPSAEDLGLPPSILQLCALPKGLVLVTGPTGSGKSTTLAAMIDHINNTRTDHIITIEDPIEFVHPNKECLVNQREVGTHTQSFKSALRAALREDPDIVLVGEMRDLETIAIAIETAETGHLVFGTLHTTTAPSTIDRVIDQFPADRQEQIRIMLSESLKGVIAQNLLKRIGGGRVAAMEVLIGIPAIANLIREGKTFQVPSIMQTGKKHGMVLLNDALAELVRKKIVDPGEAYAKAADKTALAGQLRAAGFKVPEQSSG
jgi:twitching motility protein PilT